MFSFCLGHRQIFLDSTLLHHLAKKICYRSKRFGQDGARLAEKLPSQEMVVKIVRMRFAMIFQHEKPLLWHESAIGVACRVKLWSKQGDLRWFLGHQKYKTAFLPAKDHLFASGQVMYQSGGE